MKLYRFFCPDITSEMSVLDEDESHHLRVLRLEKENQKVELFDGAGNHRIAEVVCERNSKNIVLKGVGSIETDEPFVPKTVLAVSLPKGERQDTLVQMCQELALNKLIPMFCERSPERVTKAKTRLERWHRITISAAKQSGVNFLTEICEPLKFQNIIQTAKNYSLALLFSPHGAEPITNLLNGRSGLSSVLCLIGPEGDFTEAELEEAKRCNCIPVSMPLPVMRVETAAIAALVLLRTLSNTELKK
jgi:16S rRNA (uracil1498-N3)-methyltransferase